MFDYNISFDNSAIDKDPQLEFHRLHLERSEIKRNARIFIIKTLAEMGVAPVRTVDIVSAKESEDQILFIVAVSFQDFYHNQRPEIIIPLVYNKKRKGFIKPSVFYLGREMYILGKNTINSLFVNYRTPPTINLFSPLAPLFYQIFEYGG